MSFKHAFSSKSTSKKPVISKTQEREFDQEIKKIEQLDDSTKKLYKDMKKCLEAISRQSKEEVKMSHELMNSFICKEDEKLSSCQRLDQVAQEMVQVGGKTVVEPMKKFSTIVPSIQTALKRRETALQEYMKCQAKVDKYQEKERTGANIVKLDQSLRYLSATRNDFENQHQILEEDMDALFEGRTDYARPCLHALIMSQVQLYTEGHRLSTELFSSLSATEEQSYEDTNVYSERMKDKLMQIRALSITVDE